MDLIYTSDAQKINWSELREDLIADDFHNGRSTEQLETSFRNSAVTSYVLDDSRCIATARALSDGICNAYVVDVWTLSTYRSRGIASKMMESIIAACPGQHIYLFTDDAVAFYKRNGFTERPVGLEIVSGEWLNNNQSPPDQGKADDKEQP
ncbi:MAG: GNAT family N-acetyltransferase [Pseudomonadales bacterium]